MATARQLPTAVFCLTLLACSTPRDGTRAEGQRKATATAVEPRELIDVCWPPGSDEAGRVVLEVTSTGTHVDEVKFEALHGAPNGVGRCAREILFSYPWQGPIPERYEVAPPGNRPSGWVVLAWVKMLAELHAAPDKGLVDAAPLVRACLSRGIGVRQGLVFEVDPASAQVSVVGPVGPTEAVTDSERCMVAVLGAMAYGGSRPLRLDFVDTTRAPQPAPAASVEPYFVVPSQSATSLDPQVVRDTMKSRNAQVSACWNQALRRRGGLSGGRTVRMRVAASGEVESATVLPHQTDAPGDAADYLLDRCLLEVVKGARFKTGGAKADAIYSWVFR